MTTRIYPSDQVFPAIYHFDSHTLSTTNVTQEEPDSYVSADVCLDDIPSEYRDLAAVFSKANADKLPPHRVHLDHSIPLEPGSKPHSRPTYSLSEVELEVLHEYLNTNLAKRFIRELSSPYGAPVLFVKKAHSHGLRLCVDYRVLNRSTIKNRYLLPLISEVLDRLKNAPRYTQIDLRAAYNLLRIALGEEWKTAFRTRYGHFEYLVMPFGLTNAPATFQSYINSALREYLDDFCVVYLDDILIYSKSMEEHVKHVRKVLKKLLEYGLYASLEKCQFHVEEVEFLGFVVTPEGVSMEKDKVATIVDWPSPKSVHDIQIFLGLASFYCCFIQAYSRVVLPITTLLCKTTA
jgi:hypothetical protein